MNKTFTIVSAVLWIAGVTATIVGLNLDGPVGSWVTICGNIAFFIGLAMQGVLWVRKRNQPEQAPGQVEKPKEPEDPKDPAEQKD